MSPPTAEGARSESGRADSCAGRRNDARRRDPPHRPGNGQRIAGKPPPAGTDANASRIIAYGLGTVPHHRPSGDERVWAGDVGWNTWRRSTASPISRA